MVLAPGGAAAPAQSVSLSSAGSSAPHVSAPANRATAAGKSCPRPARRPVLSRWAKPEEPDVSSPPARGPFPRSRGLGRRRGAARGAGGFPARGPGPRRALLQCGGGELGAVDPEGSWETGWGPLGLPDPGAEDVMPATPSPSGAAGAGQGWIAARALSRGGPTARRLAFVCSCGPGWGGDWGRGPVRTEGFPRRGRPQSSSQASGDGIRAAVRAPPSWPLRPAGFPTARGDYYPQVLPHTRDCSPAIGKTLLGFFW